jgi:membrane AbrB-like protein
MADMIIYSGVPGADTAKVAAAHILRVTAVILLTPVIHKFFTGHFRGQNILGLQTLAPLVQKDNLNDGAGPDLNDGLVSLPLVTLPSITSPSITLPLATTKNVNKTRFVTLPLATTKKANKNRYPNYLLLFAPGSPGGWLGLKSELAGGVILGSTLVTGLGNLLGLPAGFLPNRFGSYLQFPAGLLVGSRMGLVELLYICRALPELLIIIVSLMGASMISAHDLISGFKWDPSIARLSASPGRMSDMIVLSQSLGARSDWVAGTHLTRMILVIILTPLLLKIT